ncbi:MAG: glycosyltransferase family 4 protein, partial [Kangiellaceae bacterium]|nr:glycosyltransferase family 4 protein [Kangiellaceae bacterium]
SPSTAFRILHSLIDNYFDIAAKGDLPVIASGVCIPKYILNQIGGFAEGQVQGEDQDLWARIALLHHIALHPKPCVNYRLDAENRVSETIIPIRELAYSKNLQARLDNGEIPAYLVGSVKRYISGHLLHLAKLNIKANNLTDAKRILSDRRASTLTKRFVKWTIALKLRSLSSKFFSILNSFRNPTKHETIVRIPASTKPRVLHLVNDTKMGGITSSIDSLGSSALGENFRFLLKAVKPSSWFVKNYQADVIIVHYACSWATLLPNLITKFMNPKSKIILHEHHYTHCFEKNVPSVKRFRLMLKLNYALFDRVVAVSHGQADWVCTNGLMNEDYLQAIQQCNDLEMLLKVSAKKVGSRVTIGAFGRLVSVKGFDTLIQAFNRVGNPNLKLVIGGSGPEEQRLKSLAEGNSDIYFAGRVTNVPQFLDNCDVVIIPSTSEAFGQVCLEAKAAGKAVIASDIDGLREQVITFNSKTGKSKRKQETITEEKKHLACGELIPEHSVDSIARVLASLEDKPLEKWGKNGRENVKDAWENYQLNWTNLLKSLVSARA